MKKVLSLGTALVILLVACNQNDKPVSAGATDYTAMAEKNKAHNKEVYRAIETGDVSKLDSFFASNMVDHEANMGKDIVGADSVKKYLSELHTYIDGLKIESLSEATSQDGEYHFALVRMTGKTKANPWGMPVGMDMDDTGVDVVKIKDGKATDHWGFTSTKDMLEMMEGMKQGEMPPAKKDSTK